jgi:hypothetical protein
LIEAAAWLVVARCALVLVPFPRIARRIGTFVPPTDERVALATAVGSGEQCATAREIGWAVGLAARRVPFRAVCLPQAMAARIMLERRGVPSVMRFGGTMGGEPKVFTAHAWLDAAGVKVTGYPVTGVAEIACFV